MEHNGNKTFNSTIHICPAFQITFSKLIDETSLVVFFSKYVFQKSNKIFKFYLPILKGFIIIHEKFKIKSLYFYNKTNKATSLKILKGFFLF